MTPFFPLNPGSIGSVFKKYSFKFLYCLIILSSTLSRLSQQVWQWFITSCIVKSVNSDTPLQSSLLAADSLKKKCKSIANWSTFTLSFKHLILSKKVLFAMWTEHVPTSKKCVAPLFWSSSPSFDLNHLLTLGPYFPKPAIS